MCVETMMSLADVAAATGGSIVRGSPYASISAVSTDSRGAFPGGLFVALAGERFDGHDFVKDAANGGAAAVLIHHPLKEEVPIATVQVADTRLALGRLAAWWRKRWPGELVALTGSNGKTTVKEMIAAILRAATDAESVLATQGNLNNDIGMPLTLLKLRKPHRYAVVEMGMNHLGEIDYLTRIARPQVALINNAHRAHVGEVGGMEQIAAAKGEIFSGLDDDGVAVINADDAFADYWSGLAAGKKQISFGVGRGDVCATYSDANDATEVRFATPAGEIATRLQVPGEHNVRNAAAACAVAVALGIAAQPIGAGLGQFAGTKGRLQRTAGCNGAVIIDDSYNANPDSMAAAIAVLAKARGRKFFVVGDMGELGAEAPALHAEIGELARQSGIDALYALGDLTLDAVRSFGLGALHFDSVEALASTLRAHMAAGVTVLIKGSRFMRMERVVQAVAEGKD
jgi:UDP-N-acetylmuramoyl-tripeptide--D-alanyl-D-alanine ligase